MPDSKGVDPFSVSYVGEKKEKGERERERASEKVNHISKSNNNNNDD